MPHLSRRKLDKKVEYELLDALEYVFTRSNPGEIRHVLNSLMTRTERLMVAKRLGVVVLLGDQAPPSAIDEVLKVTKSTVSRIEFLQEIKPEGFRVALNKLGQRRVKQDLKKLLIRVAQYGVAGAGGRLPRNHWTKS